MIADFAVRLASAADAVAISRISRDAIERGLPWTWQRERVARAIRDPQTNVVGVGDPAELIAFGIMSYADDDAHLLLFAVRAATHRQGVGSAVLLWLESVARVAGARRIR